MTEALSEESLDPVQSERAVKACTNRVSYAQLEYRKTGEALIQAEREHRRAVVRAHFSPECPTVSRGGVTAAYRDAWVDKATLDEKDALKAAEINRETAIEALRSSRSALQGAMAVNASVREAYRVGIVT